MPTTASTSGEILVLPPPVVDLSTADLLARSLEQARAARPRRVVVDFADVSFCDVTAVNVLLQAADALRSSGCDLQVRHPNRFLTRVVDLLGVRVQLGLPVAA